MRKTLLKIFAFKIYAWILCLVIVAFFGIYFWGRNSAGSSDNSQIFSMVKYVEKTHQEVFLNVGLQKVISQEENTKIPWTDIGIPLSEKKALIVLNYKAKLGIKSPVKVESTGENSYNIEIPKYEVIGISLDAEDPYKLYDSSASLLSFSTTNVDTGSLATENLSNEQQKQYLEDYKKEIDESAKSYYTSLFEALDPEVKLTFTFASD